MNEFFSCSVSADAVGFLTGQSITPLIALALVVYILGFRRFKPLERLTERSFFWMNNLPTWAYLFVGTVSWAVGLFIYVITSI